ncbi:MAG: hypothetical protein M0Z55_00750 [Peptococcaceae bacterium]|nr:hypothetical protein [Peptococcaceae bacterium]
MRHKLLWAVVLLLTVSLLGCQASTRSQQTVKFDNYTDVLFPTPSQVVLTNLHKGLPQKILLKKGDITSLMHTLHASIETSLTAQKYVPSAGLNSHQPLSLELSYSGASELKIITDKSLRSFKPTKILLLLQQRMLVVETPEGTKAFSGLNIQDQFITLMQNFTAESSFPLPPATLGDQNVEQLPLAHPDQVQIDFLPPAQNLGR